jgi:vanillate O-demethylase ferredoxin subunit
MLRGPGAPGTNAVVVDKVTREAERVMALDLVAPDGSELPPFAPGGHIDVHVATGIVRQYSLCGDPANRHRYRIAVLLEAASRGGSATIHDAFSVGRRVRITAPRSHFALDTAAPYTVLVAGGIGVTPIIPMALTLQRSGAPFELHYAAHSRATAPFLAELEAGPFAAHVHPHLSAGETPRRFDALATLADAPAGAHVYVCGPARLQDAVTAATAQLGWSADRVHRERFTADVDRKGEPFTVVAARSGVTVEVPSERSIVQALADCGIEIPISCEQGVCGTCVSRVISGEVDHRDLYLSEAEKAANGRITVCCSRGRAGGTLVLDL